jgi:hypothetical protein
VMERLWWLVDEGRQLNMEGDRLGDSGQQEGLVVVLVCQCQD